MSPGYSHETMETVQKPVTGGGENFQFPVIQQDAANAGYHVIGSALTSPEGSLAIRSDDTGLALKSIMDFGQDFNAKAR